MRKKTARAIVAPVFLLVPLPCEPHRRAQCRPALSHHDGWDVVLEVDDAVVASTHLFRLAAR